ncbi:hypothetical protein FRC08_003123 [Ceratobasidium sp. 394]|nr:hypothetical protein FRC08_003123 [Ceratobasidium sp. 394]
MQAPANQAQQSTRVRLRIKSIDIDVQSRTKYPINLKLLSSGVKQYTTQAIGGDQALCWEGLNPIDADANGSLEIRVYELHWHGKKRKPIGSVSLPVSEVTNAQASITAHDTSASPSFSVTVALDSTADNYRAAQKSQEGASTAVDTSPNVLKSMERTRDAVEVLLAVAGNLAELNPIATVVVGLCKQAWETLKQQEKCDEMVAKLVTEMGDVLPYVAGVKNHAKIAKLQDTVKDLLQLVEKASQFVIDYTTDGAVARATRAFVSSSAQGQVDEFVAEFARLKENFRTGMEAQLVQRVEKLLDDADRALLEKLIVPGAEYDPSRCCLEGTRTEVLQDIHDWTLSATGFPALFWLYGPAGCGKSSIATSMSKSLHDAGSLAGSFFCKRDNEHLHKSENVISHLAASLAYKCPAYGKKLVKVLRDDPEPAHSAAVTTRFSGLIAGPLEALSHWEFNFKTLIIVVDAIDESGTAASRAELASCLLELSQLASWLKVLVTSRPNNEIRTLLGPGQAPIQRRDLFRENETSVSRDIFAYTRSRISAIPPEAAGRPQWPDDSDIRRLSEGANGLFIWAYTACNLIQQSPDPGATLDEVLAGHRSQNAKTALNAIYETALTEGLKNTSGGAKVVQLCVGAIILTGTRRPLPDSALAAMLSKRIKPHELSWVINRLGSVLYRDDLSTVRALHHSFSDYMMDEDCPEQYRIDLEVQNADLAASCLEVMLQGLRFNICGLEDSCIMNRDVVDLQTRIETNIRAELIYCCLYWTSHLVALPFAVVSSRTIELLDALLCGQHLLYWVEVLSLTDELHATMWAMDQLISWIDDNRSKYTTIAADVYRFVSATYVAISSSTPHLYVSALPFGAANYKTVKALKSYFPNTLSVTSGMNLWNVPCLRVIHAGGALNSISVSPDGRRFVSGSSDNTVRLWDAQTGAALLHPVRGHSNWVMSVAFSSDNRRIVSGSSDNTVRTWDARTGAALLHLPRGHSNWVMSVVFSPDSRRIASGSSDCTVRIWDAQTGTASLGPLRGHSSSVRSIAFSPDDQHIVSGSEDKTVRIWDAHTGAAFLHPLRGHSGSVISVAFSSDSRRIASGSSDNTVRIWDAQTGTALLNPLRGHSDRVMSVAFSPDSQRIVSGSSDKTVRIWDSQTGAALLYPLRGHSGSVRSVAFLADGRRIVSGSSDNTLRIWDAQIDTTLLNPLQGHSDRVMSVAFSSDGRRIASGSDDTTVRTWDAHTGAALLYPLRGHSNWVRSVAFSSDGRRIVSGSWDNTLRIWDARTGAALLHPLRGHSNWVMSVAFSSDSQRIISGSADKTVRIWDAQTGAAFLNPLQGHSDRVMSVAFSSDDRRIVSGSSDNTVRIWDAHAGTALLGPFRGHSGPVRSVAFSSDGQRIVSGSSDETVRIWDAHTGVALLHPLKGHSDSVMSVTFSPDGRGIASGSSDKTVRIWDVQTGAALLHPLQGHSDSVWSVAFSSDSKHIVSGSSDNTVRIWDLSTLFSAFDICGPFQNSSRVASGELSQLLREDWVCNPSGERVFWLPAAYQREYIDHSLFAISTELKDHPVAFDLSKLKVGKDWVDVIGSTAAARPHTPGPLDRSRSI